MTLAADGRLRASVESLFAPSAAASRPMSIGAELELIPFDPENRRPVPIESDTGADSLSAVRRVARRFCWSEIAADGDPPSWSLPDGGRVSFEPGGQIELSSVASPTASEMIRDVQCTAQLLGSSFERSGFLLEAVGVDPHNDIVEVPLQLHRPRYERMARYFDSIGSSGARMMRQTASLQINVQAGSRPFERWSLLNSLAPYLTAIFANSPLYATESTGHRSYRAHLWRTLDASRTGLPIDPGDPRDSAGSYFDFAVGAGAMMREGAPPYVAFGDWVHASTDSGAAATMEDWELHLTTLFPEVRPRGYFEVRSVDAIAPRYLAAPISFVAGLVYDDAAASAAAEIAGPCDTALLEIAGRKGVSDPGIRDTSLQLIDLALAGCESIGTDYLSAADLESAAEFFDRYTRQGRSPGDDWG